MKKLLYLKHWHIFLITFVLPLIIGIVAGGVMISTVITTAKNGGSPNPIDMFGTARYIFIFSLIPQVFHILHFLSKGVYLQEYLPDEMKMNVKLFKASQFVQLAFFVFVFGWMFYFFGELSSNFGELSNNHQAFEENIKFPILISTLVVFPLEILSMVSVFYGYFFIAKTVKSIQLDKEAQFSDFIGEFFFLWFYIVGMWFTQPVVNDIVNGEYEKEDM